MHEDIRSCDAFDPGGRDGAVEQCHGKSHGAFAVRDYVDLLWGVLQFADFFQGGFDIETCVESRVSLFGEDRFSDTVRDDEYFVASRSEIFDGVAADSGQCEDLVVGCYAGDHENSDFGWLGAFCCCWIPHSQCSFYPVGSGDLHHFHWRYLVGDVA